MTFPVVDQIRSTPIGVIECINKVKGLRWTEFDEAQMGQAAALMQYYLCNYGQLIDFVNAPVFSPIHLHMMVPYRPAFYNPELDHVPDAITTRKRQLVARVESHAELLAVKRDAARKTLFVVKTLGHVQELCAYLDEIDTCFKTTTADLVASKHRETDARDQVQKLLIKIKVAEENSTHLQDQLTDAKRVILAQKIASSEGTGRHDGFGTYRSNNMTQRQSLTQRSLPKGKGGAGGQMTGASSGAGIAAASTIGGAGGGGGLPPLQESLRPAVFHDFMANASRAIEELRKKAMAGSDATQRHRQFSTPQPRKAALM
jgi:hypothetical protein